MDRTQTRSTSRGREALTSTGRGGSGNMREPSRTRAVDDGVSIPVERGRSVNHPVPDHVTHSGRGGAGNVRSPSRDPIAREAAREAAAKEDAYEAEVVRARREAEAGQPRTSGRGGAGNVSNSRSRSRSRDPAARNASPGILAGRGGFGNQFHHADAEETARLRSLEEEDDKVRHAYETRNGINAVHSTGLGGAGNFKPGPGIYETDANSETTVIHPPAVGHMGGRGGAGNFTPQEHSQERERGRGPVESLKNMVRGMSRSRSGERGNGGA